MEPDSVCVPPRSSGRRWCRCLVDDAGNWSRRWRRNPSPSYTLPLPASVVIPKKRKAAVADVECAAATIGHAAGAEDAAEARQRQRAGTDGGGASVTVRARGVTVPLSSSAARRRRQAPRSRCRTACRRCLINDSVSCRLLCLCGAARSRIAVAPFTVVGIVGVCQGADAAQRQGAGRDRRSPE